MGNARKSGLTAAVAQFVDAGGFVRISMGLGLNATSRSKTLSRCGTAVLSNEEQVAFRASQ